MAKPNYQYEKRQRDLAKKLKQEEKRRQKLADKPAEGEAGGESTTDAGGTDGAAAADAGEQTTSS